MNVRLNNKESCYLIFYFAIITTLIISLSSASIVYKDRPTVSTVQQHHHVAVAAASFALLVVALANYQRHASARVSSSTPLSVASVTAVQQQISTSFPRNTLPSSGCSSSSSSSLPSPTSFLMLLFSMCDQYGQDPYFLFLLLRVPLGESQGWPFSLNARRLSSPHLEQHLRGGILRAYITIYKYFFYMKINLYFYMSK